MEKNELMEQALSLLTSTSDFLGVLPTIFSLNKKRQFNHRMVKFEDRLKKALLKATEVDANFFYEKLGTVVIQKIFLDEEDEKAEFLILGYENCIAREIREFDRIIFYFDLISDLRSFELKRLVNLSGQIDKIPPNLFSDDEQKLIQENTDRKLIQSNLVSNGIDYLNSPAILSGGTQTPKLTITKTGKRLLNFLGYYLS